MKILKSFTGNYLALIGIVILAVIARLIPHPPNFTPIGGLALFSGAHFNRKTAIVVPLAAMFISDLILGFHSTMFYVYGSFLIIAFIGFWLKNNKKIRSIIFASLFSSLIFFLVTNFGVWLSFAMYEKSAAGLLNCYSMAMPFFRNTVLGDLFYTFSFFYGFRLLANLIKYFYEPKKLYRH